MIAFQSKTTQVVRQTSKLRSGYALLICLLVAAISSTAVMGILNSARFETLEITARQRSLAASLAANAGAENAVASLLNNPNLRGTRPPIQVPATGGTTVSVDIQQSGQTITINAVATVGGISKSQQLVFTVSQLLQRVARIP